MDYIFQCLVFVCVCGFVCFWFVFLNTKQTIVYLTAMLQ